MEDRHYDDPYFTDEKHKAQRGYSTSTVRLTTCFRLWMNWNSNPNLYHRSAEDRGAWGKAKKKII